MLAQVAQLAQLAQHPGSQPFFGVLLRYSANYTVSRLHVSHAIMVLDAFVLQQLHLRAAAYLHACNL